MIRTRDPLLPKQVRYQAALHSVTVGGAVYSVPSPPPQAPKSHLWIGYFAPPCLGPKMSREAAPEAPRASNSVVPALLQSADVAAISCELRPRPPDGVSPSGKAADFDSAIRRFESCHPSHFPLFHPMTAECRTAQRNRPAPRHGRESMIVSERQSEVRSDNRDAVAARRLGIVERAVGSPHER